jgi:Fe-S cluster biogenesis protein NfuA
MEKQELEQKVKNVIDQIRPYLEADGGNIEFIELTDENVVNVELQGACATCPMSIMTLKQGVEQAMIKALPQIKSVEAVNMPGNTPPMG